MSDAIYIISKSGDQTRSLESLLANKVAALDLKAEFDQLINSLQLVFASLDDSFSNYEGKEIELSLGLTADGKIGFLGTGMGIEVASGIKIKLVKK